MQSFNRENQIRRGFRLLLIVTAFCGFTTGVLAQTMYDITPVNGNTKFPHTQTPETLVPVNPTLLGIQYQWQYCYTPFGTFLNIVAGGTSANYAFSAPLNQTTYYRRKTTISVGQDVYSNVVKYEVVSVNNEDRNYVREHDILVAGITDWKVADQLPIGSKMQSTTYMDGLGRPVQQVSRETATPSSGTLWGDIVQFSEYDAFGRQPKNYLPYTTTYQSGKYKTNASSEQPLYYTSVYNESSPYTNLTFDNSPLNRILNVKSSGTSWAAGLGNSTNYELNDATDAVRLFTIGYNANDVPVTTGIYPDNMLLKVRKTDENNKQVIEYYDKKGQVVLAKTQLDNSPATAHTGWICTYSVFDDYGRVRFRIQPEAVKYLEGNGWSFAGVNGQQVLSELCFHYEYDEKGRVTLKKAPGADPLYMLYDQRDRVVFMQDGNQRAKSPGQWTGSLYDELDRPIISVLYNTSKTITGLQSDIDNAAEVSSPTTITNPGAPVVNLIIDSRNASILTYTAQNSIEFLPGFESGASDAFIAEINPAAVADPLVISSVFYKNPISSADLNNASVSTILKYIFYDNHNFSGARPFNFNFDNSLAYPTGGEPIDYGYRTLSMLTGSLTRVLGTSTFLSSTIYYDDKGRAIQTLDENIKTGLDITTIQYQFDGRILSSNTKHSAGGGGSAGFSTVTKNNFDQIGRVASIEKKYGSNPFKAIVAYVYDDIGRIKTKRLDPGYTGSGKNELEALNYSYNIHNNITGINKDYALKTPGLYSKWGNYFGLYLGYDNRDNAFAASQLDGHVTGIMWNTQGDDAQRKYDFSYDNAGRLVNAAFNQRQTTSESWSHATMDFSVTGNTTNGNKITYDLNGNLLNMLQKGVVPGNATPVDVDNLTYTYTGLSNKLLKVVDNGTLATNNGKLGDFSDGSNASNNDYVYDQNGNLVIDLNKNVKDLGNQPGNGIRYNHLDKPEEIRIAGKGIIKIVYDADGNKLQRSYTPEGSSVTTTTTYIGAFAYQGDELQYINFEEGRIRVMQSVNQNNGYDYLTMDGNIDLPNSKRGAYDYFIRDYQGNVRMILTEQTHAGSNTATMEMARAANEEPVFGQVDENGSPNSNNEIKARFAVTGIPGQGSPGGGWTNNTIGNYVSRIGNLAGKKTGPNTLMKVMAGDEISATTIYYYQDPVVNTSGTSNVTDVLGSLVQAISGGSATSGLTHGSAAATAITSQLGGSVPFSSAVSPDAGSTAGSNPKAYLTVLFFDERFNFIADGSTNQRVIQAGNDALPLVLASIKAPKNGYAYVYVSNESDEMVYFDNLQVTHVRKHIIEENHYYAYGLRIAGISSRKLSVAEEGHIKNGYLYNDKELFEDADLNWYDYGFRMYDPQIGRFPQLDPLTDSYPYYTPYQYAGCEPVANVDEDGLEPASVINFALELNQQGIMTGVKQLTQGAHKGKWAVSWFAGDISHVKVFMNSWTFVAPSISLFNAAGRNAVKVVHSITSNMSSGPAVESVNQGAKAPRFSPDDFVIQPAIPASAMATVGPTREMTPYEKRRSDRMMQEWYDMNGYNSDGSKKWITELAETKTFQRAGKMFDDMSTIGAGLGGIGLVKNLALKAPTLFKTGISVAEAGSEGGLNLFKSGAEQTIKSGGWKTGDRMLKMFDQGSPRLNWKQNAGFLRREMGTGKPIFDSYRLPNGNLISTKGFLNAERNLLQSRGWIYSPSHGAWLPPGF